VFLIDTSGSMQDEDKLPLLKRSFAELARQLRPQDRVSIVVYAGSAGVVLAPTPGDRQDLILGAWIASRRWLHQWRTGPGAGVCNGAQRVPGPWRQSRDPGHRR
jgi:hypothetical protein